MSNERASHVTLVGEPAVGSDLRQACAALGWTREPVRRGPVAAIHVVSSRTPVRSDATVDICSARRGSRARRATAGFPNHRPRVRALVGRRRAPPDRGLRSNGRATRVRTPAPAIPHRPMGHRREGGEAALQRSSRCSKRRRAEASVLSRITGRVSCTSTAGIPAPLAMDAITIGST